MGIKADITVVSPHQCQVSLCTWTDMGDADKAEAACSFHVVTPGLEATLPDLEAPTQRLIRRRAMS